MAIGPRSGVFLDRDGTIIVDRDYPGDPAGVELLPGAAEAIGRLNAAGVPVIVVTNQSGIGRGLIDEAQYQAVRARMEQLLEERGARLTATVHCPHAPDRDPPCDCRKPLPGMFARAASEHDLDLGASWFVGDRPRDVMAGVAAGGRGYLIRSPATAEVPAGTPGITFVDTLAEAVDNLLRQGGLD